MAVQLFKPPPRNGGLYVTNVRANFFANNASEAEITLRGIVTPGLQQTIGNLYGHNGAVYLNSDAPREEWLCLYCAVPNDVARPKCEQCGAPRNWCF